MENLYLVLGAVIEGKPNLSIMISENLVTEKGLDAGKIVREAGREIKGGGGGQPFYATAGGKDSSGLQAAIEKALGFLNGHRLSTIVNNPG
jgi:alanyl-tRNA synthetase